MTGWQRALAGLVVLVLPLAAGGAPAASLPTNATAQASPGKPAKGPAQRPAPAKPSSAKGTAPGPTAKRAAAASAARPQAARPAPRPRRRTEAAPVAEAAPAAAPGPPPRPSRRGAGPELRPVDRELVRAWLAANPDWSPPGRAAPQAEGQPLPGGVSRQPLPPGLAVLLPYFPGYRYAAAGPDLVLYAAEGEKVASLLPGALAR